MMHAGDLSPREAWDLLRREPEAMLVDVRTVAEWTFVGVPDLSPLGRSLVTISWSHWPEGARNERFVEDLVSAGAGEATALMFLCRSGHRSAAAATAATAAGLSPAYNIAQGFEGDLDGHRHRGHRGWRAEGLPWLQS